MSLAAAATALSAANKIKKKGSVAVQVVVRCRPLNKKEKTEERMPIIEIEATRVPNHPLRAEVPSRTQAHQHPSSAPPPRSRWSS